MSTKNKRLLNILGFSLVGLTFLGIFIYYNRSAFGFDGKNNLFYSRNNQKEEELPQLIRDKVDEYEYNPENAAAFAKYGEGNLTQNINRSLFSSIVFFGSQDQLNPSAEGAIKQNIYNIIKAPMPDHYFLNDVLSLNPDLETYRKDLLVALNSVYYIKENTKSALEIYDRVTTKKEGAKKELLDLAELYKKASSDIIKIKSVPENIAEAHLLVANNLYKIYEALIKMTNYEDDPISSLSGLYQFTKNEDAFVLNLRNLLVLIK